MSGSRSDRRKGAERMEKEKRTGRGATASPHMPRTGGGRISEAFRFRFSVFLSPALLGLATIAAHRWGEECRIQERHAVPEGTGTLLLGSAGLRFSAINGRAQRPCTGCGTSDSMAVGPHRNAARVVHVRRVTAGARIAEDASVQARNLLLL